MFGDGAQTLTIELNQDYPGFLLAVLPPGAFFGLAILIVCKNWLDLRPQEKQEPVEPLPETI